MKSFSIALRKAEDALDFVKIVNSFDFDMDLKSGTIVIDAKSLMGVMAMAGGRNLELVVHSSECDFLTTELANFLCA